MKEMKDLKQISMLLSTLIHTVSLFRFSVHFRPLVFKQM